MFTFVAAIVFAHWSWHARLSEREVRFIRESRVQHGYADSPNARQDYRFDASDSSCPCPDVLCRLLGGSSHHIISLRLWSGLAEDHIEQLSGLSHLRLLYLPDDVHRYEAELEEMDQLHTVYMDHTNATDATVAALRNNKSLRRLIMAGTNVSDESLAVLGQFQELETLVVRDTRISVEGLRELETLLPSCDIQSVHLGGGI